MKHSSTDLLVAFELRSLAQARRVHKMPSGLSNERQQEWFEANPFRPYLEEVLGEIDGIADFIAQWREESTSPPPPPADAAQTLMP